MNDEAVRQYLSDNGYPEHIVRGGKSGLAGAYRQFVEQVERGYSLGLEDYRNDLDIRAILRFIGAEEELVDLDARLRAALDHTDVRVWESGDSDPWWDFGYPRNVSGDLLDDLRAEGLAVA